MCDIDPLSEHPDRGSNGVQRFVKARHDRIGPCLAVTLNERLDRQFLRAQRIGIMEPRRPHGFRDSKCDLNEITQIRIAVYQAGFAERVLTCRIERVKAFDDRPAAAAHIMPLHGEQARFARMQKEVNDVGLIAAMIGRILDRIDAHDLIVRRLAHKSLQLSNQIVMVRITRAESVESLLKTRFTDRRSEITHGHTLRRPRSSCWS